MRLNRIQIAGASAFAVLLGIAGAQSTIDPEVTGNRYGWSENGGWVNLRGDFTNGVAVGDSVLSGFAWAENFGWINFGSGSPDNGINYSNASATDFGVNFDPSTGELSGFAWGENIGWVNFDGSATGGPDAQVKIDLSDGVFSGFAWGENVGWIGFNGFPASVATTSFPTPPGILGDVNGDGVVNVADVTQLANWLADGATSFPDEADVNQDGVVDEDDIEALIQLIVN